MPTNKEEYFKRHKITKDSLSKSEISKVSNIPIKIIEEVYDRGIGAHKTNPQSVRTKEGKAFKWLAFGNYHHVEIIKNSKTGKYSGEFVTMMEANKRAKGIGREKQPIIKKDHNDSEFIMSLTINDLVQLEGAPGKYYRVQSLESPRNLILRLHAASTLNIKAEGIRKSISSLMAENRMQKVLVNSIGKII